MANQTPDHATVARFRARHEDAIGELFGQVLALCARAGLVGLGVVAVDGTKIAAAATHHATRSDEQIAREIVEQAAELDAAEDELLGDARGDELPVELRVAGDRRKRLRRPSRRWTPNARPTQHRCPATAASGYANAAAGSSKITNSSGVWSPNTTRGLRRGSPATGHAE